MKLISNLTCPLCLAQHASNYHQDNRRRYFQCNDCKLVFVDPNALPNPIDEKAEYDLHENNLQDQGYLSFLSRVSTPLCNKLKPTSYGLDFGCGPAPALQKLIEEQGHKVALYDPFYFPDQDVLVDCQYDFVTCTEAIEHFHAPYKQWQLMLNIIKPGGWLAIMTKRVMSREKFATWHYKNDRTHVCFFSTDTFNFLAKKDDLKLEYFSNDVVMLQKSSAN